MPLWTIYHPEGTFEDTAEKQALSQSITKFYTDDVALPAFYVVVHFIKLSSADIWVGGEKPKKPFIRFVINHIAVASGDNVDFANKIKSRFDQLLKAHIADKGYDWEYHVGETERYLWKINGLEPPPHKSKEEKLWVKLNQPVLWNSNANI